MDNDPVRNGRVFSCATAHINPKKLRLFFNHQIEGETDMTTIGSKIFGTIIVSAIFFGVGVALAHAAVLG